jgi:DegV family protein with EDD domain
VDTLSLSTGIALLAICAAKLVKDGKGAKEIYEIVCERVPHVQASFELKRLDYLHKGGRCSGGELLGATLLRIRPSIVLKDGAMKPGKKYKGSMPFAVKKYAEECLAEFSDIDTSMAFVTYSSATPEMIAMAKNALIDAGVTTIYETNAGATVTSHCGENTIGILYFNDGIKTLEL